MDAGSLKFGGDWSHGGIDRPLCLFDEIRVDSASVTNVTVGRRYIDVSDRGR
jgi:hypothetical protein